jgi:serine/threonine-protein kinase RsbW
MYKRAKRTFEFASAIENVNFVEKFVDEICDEYNISNTFFGNIIISVTEAVKNAIIFGNELNPLKKVTIKFEANPAYLSFTVIDQGKGFNFSDACDPTKDIIPGYSRQKGLFLIQKLSDIVKFYNHGSKIEMIFHVTSINRELAVERVSKINNYFSLKNPASHQL